MLSFSIFFGILIFKLGNLKIDFFTTELFKLIEGGTSVVFSMLALFKLIEGGANKLLDRSREAKFKLILGGISEARTVLEEIKNTKDRATREIFDLAMIK